MKKPLCIASQLRAFTLIELLVVIAIIGILAGLLLPVLNKIKEDAKIRLARADMNQLLAAIQKYEATYNRWPATNQSGVGDCTFGYTGPAISPLPPNSFYVPNNSEVMIILMDINQGVNANHVKNPQQLVTYNARQVSDPFFATPGFNTIDNQLYDPWGHPYIITLDMNNDGHARDAFYALSKVSKQNNGVGYYGLVNSADPTGASDQFELNQSVMIWSLGPNGKSDPTKPANQDVNKDNLLGWQ